MKSQKCVPFPAISLMKSQNPVRVFAEIAEKCGAEWGHFERF
jgi:hypothetical protein